MDALALQECQVELNFEDDIDSAMMNKNLSNVSIICGILIFMLILLQGGVLPYKNQAL